tara:strand:- start:64 stop:450 length:387 start_codon:yes stop_codon:yes gene_type:complete
MPSKTREPIMASIIGSVSIDDTQDIQDSFIEESTIEDIMELMFENDGYSYVTITMDDVEIELESSEFEFDGGSITGSIDIEIMMSDLQQALRDKVQALRNEIHDLKREASFAEVVEVAKSKIAEGLAS